MSNLVGVLLDTALKDRVDYLLNMKALTFAEPADYLATDSFGEILEKLAILHIRTWHLEDAIQEAKTDEEIADLKRKIDICFKVKRPKLIAALNAMIDDAIAHSKSLREDSVKLYKGIK